MLLAAARTVIELGRDEDDLLAVFLPAVHRHFTDLFSILSLTRRYFSEKPREVVTNVDIDHVIMSNSNCLLAVPSNEPVVTSTT